VLGGSSSINGMIYVRGQREDFDGWRDAGCTGWGWSDVAPFFARSPMRIGDQPARDPLSEAFLRAAVHRGLRETDDFNGETQEGAGYYRFNIAEGRRQSASYVYLRDARKRPNLRVLTGSLVTSVVVSGGRAIGVRAFVGGRWVLVRASREVLVAAGAIGSPRLLLASGIGPGAELQPAGVRVKRDLPGVGKNLQDHFLVRSSWEVRGLRSLNRLRSPLAQASAVARWLATRDGPLIGGPTTVGAFFKTRPDLDRPDAQIHFVPCSFDVVDGAPALHRFDGATSGVYQLRPEGRGAVRLASLDPHAPPRIEPAHLATERDRATLIAALRFQRSIFEAAPLAPIRVREIDPGDGVQSDDEWLDFARRTGESAHHVSGTCKMGTGDDAVVDPELRVRGVGALRVIDASIMPTMVSGNTHAATIAIAEKGAALVAASQSSTTQEAAE
jgi:choline dehydrogenase